MRDVVRVSLLVAFLAVASPLQSVAQSKQSECPLEAGLLPCGKNPTEVPEVVVAERTRTAIKLFDAGSNSERHYDLVNCLDGITFGFANHPQAQLAEFFGALRTNSAVDEALVERFVEYFKASPESWKAFANKAKLDVSDPSLAAVRKGIDILLIAPKRGNVPVKPDGDGCTPTPEAGQSFFFDNKDWFTGAARRAFRDPKVVAFQVKYWEQKYLEPAERDAKAIGFTADPGIFLLAFIRSNPGQVPSVRDLLNAKGPLTSIKAGGTDWQWDGSDIPKTLKGKDVSIEEWRTLLLWQAMCRGTIDRMRNRNIEFFKVYLAKRFVLPKSKIDSVENCNPAAVTLH
ncbi:MAG: hypothetical protein AAB403_09590 [Planctomycetota bacterium]